MTVTRAVQIHLASLSAGHADFEDTMALVQRFFEYTPTAFRNGPLMNAAGDNEGSCKLFALAQHCNLTETQALQCFGRHYREVLDEPAGTAHGNIRQFIGTGWSGIHFDASPLRPKPPGMADNPEEQTTP
ncbi:HopJ type III effector protein [Marinobacter caseinilyticus]|uniref:HopJ type III effector protein n=1 Tax=Marinobacter caseinilyticus TaxID=2692195 RepID=UPI00140A6D7B|nr:HopJ type III effector protein [Marinobacter caseinilyticus]